jgi:hypothetical protein
MNEYFDVENTFINDEDYLNLKNNYDLQTFPSINIICGTNYLYNLTVNLQAKKRKNSSLIPPSIYCNNINKCCDKYSTTKTPPNENNIIKFLSYFETPKHKEENDDDDDDDDNKTKNELILFPTSTDKIQKDEDDDYGYLKLKTPISPSPGDRRRLSLDTFESDAKQPFFKCLKCNNSSPHDKLPGVFKSTNNSEDEYGIRISSSRSNKTLNLTPTRYKLQNINFEDKKNNLLLTPVSTPPKDNNLLRASTTTNLSCSPSSPMIILSNNLNENKFFNETSSSKLLITELCTSTQNQLNLIDQNNNNTKHELYEDLLNNSTPLTCSINSQEEQDQQKEDDENRINEIDDEDLSVKNEKLDEEDKLLEQQIIHFIRSPTDGVCLPIFKNQDTNELNSNNDSSNGKVMNVRL